jgi:hypothetical protein
VLHLHAYLSQGDFSAPNGLAAGDYPVFVFPPTTEHSLFFSDHLIIESEHLVYVDITI